MGTPLLTIARVAAVDVELGGVRIPQGAFVVVSLEPRTATPHDPHIHGLIFRSPPDLPVHFGFIPEA